MVLTTDVNTWHLVLICIVAVTSTPYKGLAVVCTLRGSHLCLGRGRKPYKILWRCVTDPKTHGRLAQFSSTVHQLHLVEKQDLSKAVSILQAVSQQPDAETDLICLNPLCVSQHCRSTVQVQPWKKPIATAVKLPQVGSDCVSYPSTEIGDEVFLSSDSKRSVGFGRPSATTALLLPPALPRRLPGARRSQARQPAAAAAPRSEAHAALQSFIRKHFKPFNLNVNRIPVRTEER